MRDWKCITYVILHVSPNLFRKNECLNYSIHIANMRNVFICKLWIWRGLFAYFLSSPLWFSGNHAHGLCAAVAGEGVDGDVGRVVEGVRGGATAEQGILLQKSTTGSSHLKMLRLILEPFSIRIWLLEVFLITIFRVKSSETNVRRTEMFVIALEKSQKNVQRLWDLELSSCWDCRILCGLRGRWVLRTD